jgi:hypothetical protein
MKSRTTRLLTAFSILLLVFFGSVLVADEAQPMTLKGALVRVNTDANTVLVRDSDQKEMEFSYNEKTEISGDTRTFEGLAGKTGTQITVYYSKDGAVDFAAKLEVHPKPSH